MSTVKQKEHSTILPAMITKRDGSKKLFNVKKIERVIEKALRSSGQMSDEGLKSVLNTVLKELEHLALEKTYTPSVEEIQNIVEKALMKEEFFESAKAFIIYRQEHARIRRMVETESVDLIDRYLNKLDWQVKENSNMGFSLQGLNNYISSEITKTYWLEKIYPKTIKNAHACGDIHIHDLNLLSVYCVGWDLYDLLTQGFGGVEGKIHSKPPKHFRTALGQMVNFFYTLQGEAAGAQAFSNVDTLLAPFIRHDNLSFDEVKQALQEFIFNLNIPTRVGFQTPFTNVTLDLTVPNHYKGMNAIIGGKKLNETYGDFQSEMDLFNKAFLEALSEGDATKRVFTFPIPTYNITKDFDWDNPAIENLWTTAGTYGTPYFSNFINSDMSPDDARSMCCRLRIDNRELIKRGGGLFGSNPLTGSVGVVTINLPRLAFNNKTKTSFFSELNAKMELAKESLEIKRRILEYYTEVGLYPYSKHYLQSLKKSKDSYWINHFSTIGLVGMNEACLNFLGKDIGSKEGHAFATEVLENMRNTIANFQERTGNNYNLEATPAEGTAYRLALLDQKTLPENTHFANGIGKLVNDPFYTNSTHLPVNYTNDPFELLDHQDDLQTKYTGGTVIHFFLGEKVTDPQAVKNLVKKICETYHIPYFTLSPSFSICPTHGYLSGEQKKCPTCSNSCEIYTRIVGYLRPVDQWNNGKKAEFEIRTTIPQAHVTQT